MSFPYPKPFPGPPLFASGPTFSAEAQQFFDRLVTPPSDTRKTQYATLIDALVTAGIWAKLDVFYVFAAADRATALTNLKQSNYGGTEVNTVTFAADTGYTGNGSSTGITSGYNPAVVNGAENFKQDDASVFYWSNKNAADQSTHIGYQSQSGIALYLDDFGNLVIGTLNQNTGGQSSIIGSVTDSRGLHTMSRTASTTMVVYKTLGGVKQTGSNEGDASENPNTHNQPIDIFRANNGFSTGQCMVAGWGAALSSAQHDDFYTALHAYLVAVAGIAY